MRALSPPGERDQLGIEQIGADRVGEAHARGGNLDDLDFGKQPAQILVEPLLPGKCLLVGEQDTAVGDRHHIIVKRARRDRLFRLGGEQGAPGIEAVQPGDRAARLDMLAGGKGAAADAVDEDLDAGRAVARRKAHMVGGALVPERRRHRRVDGEMPRIGEGETKLGKRLRPFMAAVGHRHQIGGSEVAAAVGGVRRGRDGRGIGRPHR
jgi:hypothetical protein